MMETDGDASYSPIPSFPSYFPAEATTPPGWDAAVPTWASPSRAAPPALAPAGNAFAPAPYAPQLPPGYRPARPAAAVPGDPVGDARTTRTRLVVGLVTGFVLLVGACVGIGTAVSRVREEFTDEKGRVTLRAPYSWDGGGNPDAVSAPPTPAEKADGFEYEDLYLSSFLGGYYISIYVDEGAPASTIEAIQAQSVDGECRIWTCESRGTARAVTVDGHSALEQVLTVSNGTTGRVEVVLTVRTPTMVVRALASRDWDRGDPPDPQRLIDVLHSMTLAR